MRWEEQEGNGRKGRIYRGRGKRGERGKGGKGDRGGGGKGKGGKGKRGINSALTWQTYKSHYGRRILR